VPQYLSSAITFAIFAVIAAKNNAIINPERLFTALSLLVLLAQPLFSLYDGLYAFMSAVGCIHRIEVFLNLTSRRETRRFSNNKLSMTKGIESKNPSPLPLEDHRKCISVQSGNFGWNGNFQLRDINISVASGDVVFLLGPVASGKTTLLKAILGETCRFEGSVELDSPEIAFCEQTPWLMVCTARCNLQCVHLTNCSEWLSSIQYNRIL